MAMYLALAGAASTALDLLSSLTSSKSSSTQPTTGVSQGSKPFVISSSTSASVTTSSPATWGQSGALSPDTWNALLAAQSPSATANSATSPSNAMKDLFSQLDVNGDGSISKSEFEQQLGAGGTNVAAADNVFAKLDTDGDGSVSINELTSALQARKSGGSHHAHGGHGGGGGGLADALSQSIDGATTTTTTNSDGSTTTTLTYADGSKVTSTSAASSAGSSSAASSYNLIEKLIQSQSQAVSNASTSSVKV
ncbi:EF hand [Afipia felis]|uniref:EF hand n=3 Tax=Afipia felis TaxID=1035 RepID=A0A380W636_AFIFE|nr:hypothetical protein HMPREF9697_00163 [Afipia felis ATCC 53690]SUU76344.1 EF hand [Afipia felis]SUU84411.1 EF hand [Afipia felis]